MRFLDARGLSVDQVAAKLARNPGWMERALAAAREILDDVLRRGDAAVLDATDRFDGVRPPRLRLDRELLEAALRRIPPPLRSSLEFVARQVEAFHRPQLPLGYEMIIGPSGSRAGQRPVALDRVGIYVPGGPRGYPSSALMGTIPARIAGVREIVVATPPSRETGAPPDAVLAAAALGGATEVLVAGGAQAIGALAYGTASIRLVDKIVGPGNEFVTAAKLLVGDRVATDGIAGPSEVLVVADETLTTDVFAAELLAQSEHDPLAVAVGILVDDRDPARVEDAIRSRAGALPRGREATESLERNGWILRASDVAEALDVANALAPEHLVLAVADARILQYAVRNAGAVFLGPASPAALGDYTIGSNHILPTAGTARWRGGLGVRDFVKFVTWVNVAASDLLSLGDPARIIAREEGFVAHAAAIEARVARSPEVGP